jgi:hypothetical protein
MPPSGPVVVVCEWPGGGISLTRHELDAQLILDAADRARALFPVEQRVQRDGLNWRVGTDADIAWINHGTIRPGTAITTAVPPDFASYCTLVLPHGEDAELSWHEQAVLALLRRQTAPQPWWLGYLDTGAPGLDLVFPFVPRTRVYSNYGYVLVQAGPEQAATWRDTGWNWALPDLMFPADRSWLLSTMWDDSWTCIGGSEDLVRSFLREPELGPRARRVTVKEDQTPPGRGRR